MKTKQVRPLATGAQPQLRLRKLRKGDQSRPSRGKNLERALIEVNARHAFILAEAKNLGQAVAAHNRRIASARAKETKGLLAKPPPGGAGAVESTLAVINSRFDAQCRNEFREVSLAQRQAILDALGLGEPDLDSANQSMVRPGSIVRLEGTQFRPSMGKVLYQICEDRVVEMEVQEWSPVAVIATLNPIVGDVPLRPYNGHVWIQTNDGLTSNSLPLRYVPPYSSYFGMWGRDFFGGLFGESENGIALFLQMITDSDFRVIHVGHSHGGDGWSKLQPPFAVGVSLMQGWHVGVGAFGHAHLTIIYELKGPKGILPPDVGEVDDQGWQGWWLVEDGTASY